MSTTTTVRFDDQVAIVTGAGGGLGRAYALAFAARGAKVVVNDLGGSSKGEGKDSRAADDVVNEIRRAGGIAVANYNSVEEGEKIVETALSNFGTIDILVNNAGILRDKSFTRLSNSDWDLVHKVHLRGSFMVTRAAFPHMKKQKYGRIIMTSSVAGIYGNFGQANYSAAKLGLLGLSNTIAIEGQQSNIHCNTVVPMGGTRLTENILPPDLFNELKPELIAPLVLWLCHRDCEDTGGLFEAAGGWFGKHRWERSKGQMCRNSLGENVTPEAVRDNWHSITDFTNPLHVESNNEAAGLLAVSLEELKDKQIALQHTSATAGRSGPLSAVGRTLKDAKYCYDIKDVILYALSVGASTRDKAGLKFLYEGAEDFTPLPTFAIIPSQAVFITNGFLSTFSGWKIDFSKVLHGEHYIELLGPLPSSGTLSNDVTVVDVLDKGSGAVIIADVISRDQQNNVVAKNQWLLFVVGDGRFGGPRSSTKAVPLGQKPSRNPDDIFSVTTSVDQAAWYRLNGDLNPLHIDPNFAALGGFPDPILHGLCPYAMVARAVLEKYCDNDVTKFKAIKTRFAKPVIPGQTLLTSLWKEGARIHFETLVKETSEICLSGGYVDISETNYPSQNDAKLTSKLRCEPLLRFFADNLAKTTKPRLVPSKDVIVWIITKNGEVARQWTFDFAANPQIIYEGPPRSGLQTTTVTLDDDVFTSIAEGKTDFLTPYAEGNVKISGLFPPFKIIWSSLLANQSKL